VLESSWGLGEITDFPQLYSVHSCSAVLRSVFPLKPSVKIIHEDSFLDKFLLKTINFIVYLTKDRLKKIK
jgi:hypothetical protein